MHLTPHPQASAPWSTGKHGGSALHTSSSVSRRSLCVWFRASSPHRRHLAASLRRLLDTTKLCCVALLSEDQHPHARQRSSSPYLRRSIFCRHNTAALVTVIRVVLPGRQAWFKVQNSEGNIINYFPSGSLDRKGWSSLVRAAFSHVSVTRKIKAVRCCAPTFSLTSVLPARQTRASPGPPCLSVRVVMVVMAGFVWRGSSCTAKGGHLSG